MIIEIDHVAVSSMKFKENIETLKLLGYKPVFIEKNIKNLQIKRGLVTKFGDRHDLALFSSKSNVNIELINHGYVNPRESYIIPIFENPPNNLLEKFGKKKFKNIEFMEAKLKGFDAPVYIFNNTKNATFRFNKMVIKTKDVERSVDFWRHFGLKIIEIANDFAVLKFKSIFHKKEHYFYIEKCNNIDAKPLLDERGFNCIAFVSNSPERENETLNEKYIKTTKLEKFSLSGKELNVFFALGPNGELVEIVGVENK
jgi:hypothetical protein